ncbi:MAG: phosphoribosyltransferase family protein [Parcubacteria group bacterium]
MKHELTTKFISAFQSVLDVIMPGICAHCGKDVTDARLLCDYCEKSIIIRKAPKKLGERFLFAATDYKDSAIQSLIKAMKYKRVWKASESIGKIMLKHLEISGFAQIIKGNKDVFIVPIPIHFFKNMRRGFNQSEILAKVIGRHLQIPVVKALKRQKWTPPQSEITDDKIRLLNVLDCFSLSHKAKTIPRDSAIIILDDVITSGGTIKEAAKVLKPLHPRQIIFVSAASR